MVLAGIDTEKSGSTGLSRGVRPAGPGAADESIRSGESGLGLESLRRCAERLTPNRQENFTLNRKDFLTSQLQLLEYPFQADLDHQFASRTAACVKSLHMDQECYRPQCLSSLPGCRTREGCARELQHKQQVFSMQLQIACAPSPNRPGAHGGCRQKRFGDRPHWSDGETEWSAGVNFSIPSR